MKKSILSLAIVGVGVVAAAPYLSGYLAQSETERMVAEFNQNSDEYGFTTIKTYDRGYRSSQVSYEYKLPAGLAALIGYEEALSYDCDYTHGITGIDYSCDLLTNPGYKQFVDQYFDGQDPVSITGAISAFGNLTQDISTRAINKQLDDGSVINIEPSSITISTDADFVSYDMSGKLGALELADPDGSLSMSASQFEWDLRPTELGLFAGDYSFRADEVSFLSGAQNTLMSGVDIAGATTEVGDNMDSVIKFSMASLKTQGDQAVLIEDASFGFDILGVNSKALVEYQEFATNLQSEMMSNIEEGQQPGMDPAKMMELVPILEKMLNKDLTLKMDVDGKLEGKQNSANLDIRLLEKTSFTQLSAIVFNPESVLKSFDIKLNASLDGELVDSHPVAGAMLGASPLFEKSSGNYQANIEIGESSKVNGKEVTFQELQMMMMSGAAM